MFKKPSIVYSTLNRFLDFVGDLKEKPGDSVYKMNQTLSWWEKKNLLIWLIY